jgi:hypothetical protein
MRVVNNSTSSLKAVSIGLLYMLASIKGTDLTGYV